MTDTATEADYFSVEPTFDATLELLYATDNPTERAALLNKLAELEAYQASIHTAVWGPDPIEHENNRDMAESLALSAMLYRALADVETARATGQPRQPAADERVEAAAGHLFDDLITASEFVLRADLLDELYETVAPIVGGQAAEILPCLITAYDDMAPHEG